MLLNSRHPAMLHNGIIDCRRTRRDAHASVNVTQERRKKTRKSQDAQRAQSTDKKRQEIFQFSLITFRNENLIFSANVSSGASKLRSNRMTFCCCFLSILLQFTASWFNVQAESFRWKSSSLDHSTVDGESFLLSALPTNPYSSAMRSLNSKRAKSYKKTMANDDKMEVSHFFSTVGIPAHIFVFVFALNFFASVHRVA